MIDLEETCIKVSMESIFVASTQGQHDSQGTIGVPNDTSGTVKVGRRGEVDLPVVFRQDDDFQ